MAEIIYFAALVGNSVVDTCKHYMFKVVPNNTNGMSYFYNMEDAINNGNLNTIKYYRKCGVSINKPITTYGGGYSPYFHPDTEYKCTFSYILQHPSKHKDAIIDYYINEVVDPVGYITNHCVLKNKQLFEKIEKKLVKSGCKLERMTFDKKHILDSNYNDMLEYDKFISDNKKYTLDGYIKKWSICDVYLTSPPNITFDKSGDKNADKNANKIDKLKLKLEKLESDSRNDEYNNMALLDYVAAIYGGRYESLYKNYDVFNYLVDLCPITEKTIINNMYFCHNTTLIKKVANLGDIVNKKYMGTDILTCAIYEGNTSLVEELLKIKITITNEHIEETNKCLKLLWKIIPHMGGEVPYYSTQAQHDRYKLILEMLTNHVNNSCL